MLQTRRTSLFLFSLAIASFYGAGNCRYLGSENSGGRALRGEYIWRQPQAIPEDVHILTAEATKLNGGADFEEWKEGPAPSGKLGMQSFQFAYLDPDSPQVTDSDSLRHVGLWYNRTGASSRFHDASQSEDAYSWSTRAVVLPSGTTTHQVSGRNTQGYCQWTDDLENPGYGHEGIFVLSGFSLEWSKNTQKLLHRITVEFDYTAEDETLLKVCFADEGIDLDFQWRVDYALVPADKVFGYGTTPTQVVEPYYPRMDHQYHLGLIPAGTHPVLTGFDIVDVEFQHQSDQFVSVLGMDVSDTGLIQVQFLGSEERRHHKYWWKAGWAIVEED